MLGAMNPLIYLPHRKAFINVDHLISADIAPTEVAGRGKVPHVALKFSDGSSAEHYDDDAVVVICALESLGEFEDDAIYDEVVPENWKPSNE